jgi:hypothetical protein
MKDFIMEIGCGIICLISRDNNKNDLSRQKSIDYSTYHIVSVGCVNDIISANYKVTVAATSTVFKQLQHCLLV